MIFSKNSNVTEVFDNIDTGRNGALTYEKKIA
jgi:hypothetical protein